MGVDKARKQRHAPSFVALGRWASFAGSARTADEATVDDNSAGRQKNRAVKNTHIVEGYACGGDLAVAKGTRGNVVSYNGLIVDA